MPSESQDDSSSPPLTVSSLDITGHPQSHLPDPMQLLQEVKGRPTVPAPFTNCRALSFTSFYNPFSSTSQLSFLRPQVRTEDLTGTRLAPLTAFLPTLLKSCTSVDKCAPGLP